MAILVTGGARSGKSSFAEQLASRLGDRGIYVATSRVWDDEMSDRVSKHKADRVTSDFQWETIEEPLELAQKLYEIAVNVGNGVQQGQRPPVVLVDCLTLWLTNWLMIGEEKLDGQSDRNISEWLMEPIDQLESSIMDYPYPLVIVTNEVGDGIVPAYSLGRKFRDEAGRLNQRIAARCDRVFLVTAGIPIELKSQVFQWENL
ncbi:MAG: bifunctional adenosylcobinamide kinase/adenosylcobinamide-phosphate guanylyltransferase [Candidatus Pristimantibacillus sp.]